MLRLATLTDAAAILDIYAPIVRDTAISFEIEPPTLAEMRSRIESTLERFPWLVETSGSEAIIGYAYARQFRDRPAYNWTAETTIYIASNSYGRGIGTRLYTAILRILAHRGYVNAIGGITLPNAASVALHEKLGFRKVAHFPQLGFKFNRWHDVGFWQKQLLGASDDSRAPRVMDANDCAAVISNEREWRPPG
jgi:L-amino acid N-acyltransferase YncA